MTEDVIFKLYDTTFDEAELGGLIAFYRTPAGKKAANFLPTLSSAVQNGLGAVVVPKLQALVKPLSESETAKLKQKIADIKAKKPSN